MATGSYWDKFTRNRVTRRRALQMAALTGAAAGAVAVVGCGGDDDDDDAGTGSPSAGRSPAGEGEPQYGTGIVRGTLPLITGKDPHPAGSFIPHAVGSYTYSRLMRFQTVFGELPDEDRYRPVPELASEVENPDPLTYIFTINPEAKFHDVPPVNGRQVVAQDIVDSYGRYSQLSPNKGNLNEIVDTITPSSDGTQVTFKLKSPFGLFLHRVASYQDLWIIPKELYEPKTTEDRPIGSGPFMFDAADSTGVRWKRNPNYFEKDENGNQLPYLDGAEIALIPDPNQVISQFVAGQLDTIFVDPKLVESVRAQARNASIDAAPRNILNFMYFEPASYTADKPPFNDERVRRAFSMSLDRDALLNLISDEGGEWPNMPINPGFAKFWWLDPKGNEIGDAGQYYQYNIQEARALLSAAGLSGGVEVPMHFASNVYTIVVPYYETIRQAIPDMVRESGFRLNGVPEEYSSVYITRTFAGQFDGAALGLESVFSDVGSYWTNMFYPRESGGGRNHSSVNDATLNGRIKSMLELQDVEEIRDAGLELQKYTSEMMYYVPIINPVEFTARQNSLQGVVNTKGPTTYAVGTEGSLLLWKEA